MQIVLGNPAVALSFPSAAGKAGDKELGRWTVMEATARRLWELREACGLGAATVSCTVGSEICLAMAGSTQTQQAVAPLLRSCVLAETCDHRPVVPGSEILCSGCGTGKKLKARCKNFPFTGMQGRNFHRSWLSCSVPVQVGLEGCALH